MGWSLTTMGMHLDLAVTIFPMDATLFSVDMSVLWDMSGYGKGQRASCSYPKET